MNGTGIACAVKGSLLQHCGKFERRRGDDETNIDFVCVRVPGFFVMDTGGGQFVTAGPEYERAHIAGRDLEESA